MISKSTYTLSLLFLCSLFIFFASPSAHAHRIRVFAYESGGMIITQAEFSSGRPAINISINVEDNAGTVLLSGTTDQKGEFSFSLTPEIKERKTNLNIIADAGQGHRGSWILEAEDYLIDNEQRRPHAQTISLPFPKNPQKTEVSAQLDPTTLEQIVEKVVAQELAPIKRTLAEQQERKLTLQDILGGIGYIFGLAGIAAYVQAKKHRRNT